MKQLEIGEKSTWEGTISKVIYIGQNNYAIVQLLLIEPSVRIIAEGYFDLPQNGAKVKVTGEITYNTKYSANQIHVNTSEIYISDDRMIALKFLLSGAVSGIGEKSAELLIDKYGTDLSSYMTDVQKLSAIKGISITKARRIVSSFNEKRHLLAIYVVVKGRVTLNQANKIYEKYGKESESILKANPYKLIHDIDNFGFITVDDLAIKIGYEPLGEERLSAAAAHILNQAETGEGHLFMPFKETVSKAQELVNSYKEMKHIYYKKVLGLAAIPDDCSEWEGTVLWDEIKNHERHFKSILEKWQNEKERETIIKKQKFTIEEVDTINYYLKNANDISHLIEKAIINQSIELKDKNAGIPKNAIFNDSIRFIMFKTNRGEKKLYNKNTYIIEKNLADTLKNMSNKEKLKPEITEERIKKAIKNIEEEDGFLLNDDQVTAVNTSVKNRVSVITGGPGRGKTTIIKAIIKAWDNPEDVILLAPTGKAAKRMTESTGHEAYTIHRYILSNAEGVTNDKTFVIIDECSMLDINLANWLLGRISRAQVCFVGDVDQLPSVGAGAFLEDIINSKVIATTKLEHCHRNAGSILYNSTIINEGHRLQELMLDNHFRTLWLQDSANVLTNILNTYKKQLEIYNTSDMIVLTPMRKNITGVSNLNKELQAIANPKSVSKKEIQIGDTILRVGDRVMHIRNNYEIDVEKNGCYEKGVFNGETGTITDIDFSEDIITVAFDDGKIAWYEKKYYKELTLAYALTYHKSQGSEYKFVICVLTTADYVLLQRKILYTGESRAKDKCFFIGMANAFQMAINDVNKAGRRNTSLAEFLN